MQSWSKTTVKKQSYQQILKHLDAIKDYFKEGDIEASSNAYELARSYCLLAQEHLSDLFDEYKKALDSDISFNGRMKIQENFLTIVSLLRLTNLLIGHFIGFELGQKNLLAKFGNYRDLIN